MTDLVERVSMAIAASDAAEPLMACACMGKKKPSDPACSCKMYAARRRAKVAMEAMRVPTEAMLEAGAENDAEGGGTGNPSSIWPAMIDAALVPSPPLREE